MKMLYQETSENAICIQLYLAIWEIILYLQANPYRLKTKNINSLIFISTIIKLIFLFFVLQAWFS